MGPDPEKEENGTANVSYKICKCLFQELGRTSGRHLTKTQGVWSPRCIQVRSPVTLWVTCLELKYSIDQECCRKHHPWQLLGKGMCASASATLMQTPAHLTLQLHTFTGLKDCTVVFTSDVEVCFPPCQHHYLHSAIQQTSVPGRCEGTHH